MSGIGQPPADVISRKVPALPLVASVDVLSGRRIGLPVWERYQVDWLKNLSTTEQLLSIAVRPGEVHIRPWKPWGEELEALLAANKLSEAEVVHARTKYCSVRLDRQSDRLILAKVHVNFLNSDRELPFQVLAVFHGDRLELHSFPHAARILEMPELDTEALGLSGPTSSEL